MYKDLQKWVSAEKYPNKRKTKTIHNKIITIKLYTTAQKEITDTVKT